MERYMERVGGFVTHAELQYQFQQGFRVDVASKDYTEARLVQQGDMPIVLLRTHTHLATVVYARAETVTFLTTTVDIECRNCGTLETNVEETAPCGCGEHDWRLLSPP